MKQKLEEYFLNVSESKGFASRMIKFVEDYIAKNAPESGSTIMFVYGTDLTHIAEKTGADLSRYFYPGDLDAFEMEISIKNREIDGVTYVDAPRKRAVSFWYFSTRGAWLTITLFWFFIFKLNYLLLYNYHQGDKHILHLEYQYFLYL